VVRELKVAEEWNARFEIVKRLERIAV